MKKKIEKKVEKKAMSPEEVAKRSLELIKEVSEVSQTGELGANLMVEALKLAVKTKMTEELLNKIMK